MSKLISTFVYRGRWQNAAHMCKNAHEKIIGKLLVTLSYFVRRLLHVLGTLLCGMKNIRLLKKGTYLFQDIVYARYSPTVLTVLILI